MTAPETQPKKLVLVDAYSLLFRAYFGGRFLSTSDGRPTGALFGFANMLFSILSVEKPDSMVVCWDAHEQTQRSKEFEAYKAHRPEIDQQLIEQFPGARVLVEAMGIAFDPSEPGTAEVAVDPYLQNTLGALQGGIVAIFAEATAERLAASVLGAPVRVRGLELQYLKLGKVGPIRARARELGRTASGLIVRVELDDRGQRDALLTVATVWIDRLVLAPGSQAGRSL